MTAPTTPATGSPVALTPWSGAYARTTAGIFALAFLFAFEALAVATVMPDVAADLGGLRWYAVAFAAPLAASVLALVVAGPAIDRRGPGPALVGGLLVFCLGVVLAGLAPSMVVFLLGRLVHGLGGGVLGVALYVVVAQAYPDQLRPRVFAVLTAAWVLPALVGPVVAAAVADAVGWRWVFLGVPVVAVAAWLLVRGAPSRSGGGAPHPAPGRLALALAAAGGVLLVGAAGQRELTWWPVLALAGVVAIVLAGPRLLPPGAWTGGRGLPSVLGARGLIGAAFAAAEVYVPLLLILERDLSLTQAGWVLTTGAVTWCAGAQVAARWSLLADQVGRVRLGTMLVAAGVAGFTSVAAEGVPLALPVLAWAVTGLGIGMAFSTLSVLALAASPAGEEGRVSSALQLSDYLAQSTVLALGSVVFAGFATRDPATGAVVLVAVAGALGVLALVPTSRLRA